MQSPESEHMDNGEENDASATAITCPDGDPPAVDQAEAPFLGPPPN